jgi:hypothetical protein
MRAGLASTSIREKGIDPASRWVLVVGAGYDAPEPTGLSLRGSGKSRRRDSTVWRRREPIRSH